MAGNEILLDVGQVAAVLKISIATVRRWVLQGYIPYMKIGKAIRFSNSDIEKWVSAKCINSKKQEGVQPQSGCIRLDSLLPQLKEGLVQNADIA